MNKLFDFKDMKILYHLDINCRIGLKEIAKKVRISKQVADYRIKRLIENRVIKKFYTVINFSKLGYTHYKIYFKFQNVDLEKENEIVNYWIRSNHSIWVASCMGRWDLAVSIITKNVVVLEGILTDFLSKYSNYILEKNILITPTYQVFTKNYLNNKKEKKEFLHNLEIEKYEIDRYDEELLHLIGEDSRTPIYKLMEKTNAKRDKLNYRLKKLEKEGVILQYRAMIDLNKIGYHLYKIILRLKNMSPRKERELKQFLEYHPNCVQFLKLLGNWDYELEFEIENDRLLNGIMLEIRNKFSDIIRDYEFLTVYNQHKLDYFPF